MAESRKSSLPKLQRCRASVKQSKYGCFTCKNRRIKCDEEKPTCIRCKRSNRICEGYAKRTPSVNSEKNLPAVSEIRQRNPSSSEAISLSPGILPLSRDPTLPKLGELAELGVKLIASNSFRSFGTSGSLLEDLLPQLCISIPCLNATATALGTTYLSRTNPGGGSQFEEFAAFQYVTALQKTRKHMDENPDGSISIALACFLLATTEVLLEQVRHAVIHLRGAFTLLRKLRDSRIIGDGILSIESQSIRGRTIENDLDNLFQAFDLRISAFALSYQPNVLSSQLQQSNSAIDDLTSSRIMLLATLQTCFSWTAKVVKLQYDPTLLRHGALLIEQGSHIADLNGWLHQFKNKGLSGRWDSAKPTHETLVAVEHALTLRMTCTSALIYVSNVLSPLETAYDAYAFQFQQIVVDAERIHAIRSCEAYEVKRPPNHFPDFSTGPGMVQPLFLTAEKYREPKWRRRAIICLFKAGVELPFNGPREAVIALRLLQHEEAWPQTPPAPPSKRIDWSFEQQYLDILRIDHHRTPKSARDICEAARLKGCVMHPLSSNGHVNTINVTFHRCEIVEDIQQCNSEDGNFYDQSFARRCDWNLFQEMLEY